MNPNFTLEEGDHIFIQFSGGYLDIDGPATFVAEDDYYVSVEYYTPAWHARPNRKITVLFNFNNILYVEWETSDEKSK